MEIAFALVLVGAWSALIDGMFLRLEIRRLNRELDSYRESERQWQEADEYRSTH